MFLYSAHKAIFHFIAVLLLIMITLIVWGAYNAAMHNSTVVEGRIFGVVSLFAVQDNSLFTVYRKNLFTPGTNCGKISLILFGGHSAMHSALTTKKRPSYLTLAFLLPFFGVLLVMLFSQYKPFGSYAILYSDMYHQYYPFFVEFRNTLRSGGSLLHNWSVGMGMDYLAMMAEVDLDEPGEDETDKEVTE